MSQQHRGLTSEQWESVSPPPEGTIFAEEGGAQGSAALRTAASQMVKSAG